MPQTHRSTSGVPLPSESDINATPRREGWARAQRDPWSNAVLARDSRHFLHQAVSSPCLSVIRKAEGIWIEDGCGRRMMDFHGNSAHHLGYGHPRLIEAIKDQLEALSFAPRRFTCEPAVALAEKLADISPGRLGKVLFATGGSDAIEIALKVARAATGRFKTVSFWESFHGAGFGASSVGGEQLFRSGPAGPLLAGTEHVAPFACYRCPYGHRDRDGGPDLDLCRLACASYLRYVLEREGDVAAVVAEPARAVPLFAPPGFWTAVRQACDDLGVLLIFDEIPTGLGKTGKFFASEHEGVEPDIMVLGKSLGGGTLPLAAALCQPELDVAGDYALGHYTHEKNPVLCRAGLTTIEIIEQDGLVENARARGARALERLQEMRAKHPLIGQVRGRGLLMGIELVRDRTTKEPAAEAAEAVLYRCLEKGLSFKTTMGNVLTLTPPLIVTDQDMDRALDILEEAIDETERTDRSEW